MKRTKWTLKLNASGFVSGNEETLKTTNCTMEMVAEEAISSETAKFIRTHILESVLSDFYGFDVGQIIAEHIEITEALKYK
jgi:hypothetical protein